MLNDKELEEKIEATPAARVTKDDIKARIRHTSYHRLTDTVTMCNLELDNGYSVRGESACVNPENYDREIGERIAYDNAFQRLWPVFGFLLAEDQFRSKRNSLYTQRIGRIKRVEAPDVPIYNPLNELRSVLRGPEGKACISVSLKDLEIIDRALASLSIIFGEEDAG